MPSVLENYLSGGYQTYGEPKRKKKRSAKGYVIINGKAYRRVGSAPKRRKRSETSYGYGGGSLLDFGGGKMGMESMQTAKTMYNTGKGFYKAGKIAAPLVSSGIRKLKGRGSAYELSHRDADNGMEFSEKFRSYRHARAAEEAYRKKGKKVSIRSILG